MALPSSYHSSGDVPDSETKQGAGLPENKFKCNTLVSNKCCSECRMPNPQNQYFPPLSGCHILTYITEVHQHVTTCQMNQFMIKVQLMIACRES